MFQLQYWSQFKNNEQLITMQSFYFYFFYYGRKTSLHSGVPKIRVEKHCYINTGNTLDCAAVANAGWIIDVVYAHFENALLMVCKYFIVMFQCVIKNPELPDSPNIVQFAELRRATSRRPHCIFGWDFFKSGNPGHLFWYIENTIH